MNPIVEHVPQGFVPAGSWDHSGDQQNVDFTGLGKFRELLAYGEGLTLSATGICFFLVSTNNGAAWISGNSLYTSIAQDGTVADLFFGTPYFTGTTSARRFEFYIPMWGRAGVKKPVFGNNSQVVETLGKLNAIRFSAVRTSDYSTAANLTAGSLRVFGRR